MADEKRIAPEELTKQVAAYREQRPSYIIFADVLERVLRQACAVSRPQAMVQARAKSVSSFAEKCARRYDKYPDAVNQMTDLCGARVIVQTLDQVQGVRDFIESNFHIIEKEDKALLLNADEFGYRDMHYILQLRADRDLGIKPNEARVIGTRKAEIQVRTWVQHAWADVLHDRMYKTKLKFSTEANRTGALLAALMEDGDRAFDRLAIELDGMILNYTAHASKEDVHNEIYVQELLLASEKEDQNKPRLALTLARLVSAEGAYKRMIELLTPYAKVEGPLQCEVWLELGYALCKVHRQSPKAAGYLRGRDYLQRAAEYCERAETSCVPDLRKRQSLRARALARLGWSWEVDDNEAHRVRECYRRAHENEPNNPYYLADMLGFELRCAPNSELTASMRTAIRHAVTTCHEHAAAGIESPYAHFTAGRLNLLLNEPDHALLDYVRGVRHYVAEEGCAPPDVLDTEIAWLHRVNFGAKLPKESQWVKDLLALAQSACTLGRSKSCQPRSAALSVTAQARQILIIAGGASSMDAAAVAKIRPLLSAALKDFHGTVIAGGTMAGVPGCVGELAAELKAAGNRHFELIGYIPQYLPNDAPKDTRYDNWVVSSDEDTFSPEQLLRNWVDIISRGVSPADVKFLGFGGGSLSAIEYRIALAFGACVGVVMETGGAADDLLKDPLWSSLPNLLPLPFDPMSILALAIIPSQHRFEEKVQEDMAKEFHARYVAGSTSRLPNNMKPWPKLSGSFKKANMEQAQYSVQILEACGFGVREAKDQPVIFQDFRPEEIERMAELEHGRWNVERLRDGWRYGIPRDDSRKIHNYIVPWDKLPEDIKRYDRESVRAIPEILAKGGLEVYRK